MTVGGAGAGSTYCAGGGDWTIGWVVCCGDEDAARYASAKAGCDALVVRIDSRACTSVGVNRERSVAVSYHATICPAVRSRNDSCDESWSAILSCWTAAPISPRAADM